MVNIEKIQVLLTIFPPHPREKFVLAGSYFCLAFFSSLKIKYYICFLLGKFDIFWCRLELYIYIHTIVGRKKRKSYISQETLAGWSYSLR